jgi:kinetochore protein NDC80
VSNLGPARLGPAQLRGLTVRRYERLVLRSSALREELHRNVDRMLNDVVSFKISVQRKLDNYEGFVAGELERELS